MNGQKKNALGEIVIVGFALFSMFFGAGNVIFPPFLGMEAGSRWLEGFSAYFIADIGLAMMGMFALLRVGSSEQVLRRAGKLPAEILMCAIVLCIGPMVAIPRTSASTYEMAIAPNLSGVSPVVFSVAFFALILVLCLKESAVVDIVGKVLTPLLLVGLFAIIIKGIVTPLGEIAALPQISNVTVTGIKAGYQTMDALAALPFGIIILQSVTAKGYKQGKSQLRVVGGAALLAGVLLLAVYGSGLSGRHRVHAVHRLHRSRRIDHGHRGGADGQDRRGHLRRGGWSGLRHHGHRADQLRGGVFLRAVPGQGELQGIRGGDLRVQRRGVQSGTGSHRGRGRAGAGCRISPRAGAYLHLPYYAQGTRFCQPRRGDRRAADQRSVYAAHLRRVRAAGGGAAAV